MHPVDIVGGRLVANRRLATIAVGVLMVCPLAAADGADGEQIKHRSRSLAFICWWRRWLSSVRSTDDCSTGKRAFEPTSKLDYRGGLLQSASGLLMVVDRVFSLLVALYIAFRW